MKMECKIKTMKKSTLTVLFLMIINLPAIVYGQELCDNCALWIVEDVKQNNCCNECLVNYYTSRLKQDIIRGNLLASDVYSKTEVAQMPKISDSISSNFIVISVKEKNGYYLDDNDSLHRCDFFLVFLKSEENALLNLSSIVLVTNENEQFVKNQSYILTLYPYFKRDQGIRIVNDQEIEVIRSPKTLFDLVYKNWLVCKLEYGINYFFLQ